MLKGKRRLKARPGSLVDKLREKEKLRQGRYVFTEEQKKRRNELARERYKLPDYDYGKEYRKEKGNEYYKANKVYLENRKIKREYEKLLQENLQLITIAFFLELHIKSIVQSSASDKMRLRRKQISMKQRIKEHMYKLKIKERTKHLSKKVVHQIGLTADEVSATYKKIVNNLK